MSGLLPKQMEKTMPKRVPAQSITVARQGKMVVPKIGEPFEFTADEIKDVERLNPSAFAKTRVVAADDEPVVETTPEPAAAAKPAAKPAVVAKGGAKKAATTEGL